MGVNADGRRGLLGLKFSDSEYKCFWIDFIGLPMERGLTVVKLVFSMHHAGLAIANLTNQRDPGDASV